jgi:hypothetical protein
MPKHNRHPLHQRGKPAPGRPKPDGVAPHDVASLLPHCSYDAVIIAAVLSKGNRVDYQIRCKGALTTIDAVNLIAELCNIMLFDNSYNLDRSYTPDETTQALPYLRGLITLLVGNDHSTPQ